MVNITDIKGTHWKLPVCSSTLTFTFKIFSSICLIASEIPLRSALEILPSLVSNLFMA